MRLVDYGIGEFVDLTDFLFQGQGIGLAVVNAAERD
jgi:hypothetical protein